MKNQKGKRSREDASVEAADWTVSKEMKALNSQVTGKQKMRYLLQNTGV
jgi:hypothetical protein